MDTYYDVLGVQQDATKEEIKRAFKRLALRWHPDKNNGSVEAETQFKLIGEAYDTLREDSTRRAYDEQLDDDQSDTETEFNDFYHRAGANQANSQADMERTLQLLAELMDAYTKEMERQKNLGQKLVIHAYNGDWDKVNRLIQEKPNVNEQLDVFLIRQNNIQVRSAFDVRVTALHIAVMSNDFNHAKELIDAGADVNISNDRGWTPLHLAAAYGNIAVVKLLREKGAYPHFTTKHKDNTALHIAIAKNQQEVALYLIENPSETRNPFRAKMSSNNRKSRNGTSPLYMAINKAYADQTWWNVVNQLLIRSEVTVNFQDYSNILSDNDGYIPAFSLQLIQSKYNQFENEIKRKNSGCVLS